MTLVFVAAFEPPHGSVVSQVRIEVERSMNSEVLCVTTWVGKGHRSSSRFKPLTNTETESSSSFHVRAGNMQLLEDALVLTMYYTPFCYPGDQQATSMGVMLTIGGAEVAMADMGRCPVYDVEEHEYDPDWLLGHQAHYNTHISNKLHDPMIQRMMRIICNNSAV